MPGIVLNGNVYPVPGVTVGPYQQVTRVSTRRLTIRAIVVHTNTGQPVRIVTGTGADAGAEQLGAYNARTARAASWDYSVDADSIAVSNDPLKWFTWHASQVNGSTVGIEMRVASGTLDTRTLANTLALCRVLTGLLGIQRQIPWVGGRPYSGLLERTRSGHSSGADLVGLYGHDNAAQRGERGPSDSPDAIWQTFHDAGFEGFDFNADEDRAAWRPRQTELGVEADGIPGAATVAALAARGRACGIWVPAPDGCPAAIGTVPAPAIAIGAGRRGRAPTGAGTGGPDAPAAPTHRGLWALGALAAGAGAYVAARRAHWI